MVGDAAYTNSELIRNRPNNVTIFGRGRLDAALYKPAGKRQAGQMGRPRVRGPRLACPEARARRKKAPWKRMRIDAYGRRAIVRVLVIDALWYTVGHTESLPWYSFKPDVTFSDMLATIRRASWSERLLDPTASAANLRKRIRPLVDYVSSAA